MRKYRSRSVSETLDITSEFNLRYDANSAKIRLYQNGSPGGYYSQPIYTVPAGCSAKLMGIRVEPILKYTYTISEAYKIETMLQKTHYSLKVNNHSLSAYGGFPHGNEYNYTLVADQYLYLNEGASLYFTVFDTNHVLNSSSPVTSVSLESFDLVIFLSIIEEYEEE